MELDPHQFRDIESRIDELLVRYWDGSLDEEQADELDDLLDTDPVSEERVEAFCLQALTMSESAREVVPAVQPMRDLSRRRWLWPACGSVAGGIIAAAVILSVSDRANQSAPAVDLVSNPTAERGLAVVTATGGTVNVNTSAGNRRADAGTVVSAGNTISTIGTDSWAVLDLKDGSSIRLAGDSVIALDGSPGGPSLFAHKGLMLTQLRPAHPESWSLGIRTAEVQASADAGTSFELNKYEKATEIRTIAGRVQLYKSNRLPLVDVSTGQLATIDADGNVRKVSDLSAPDRYEWDLSRPLPKGWLHGHLVSDPTALPYGSVVVPVPELDKEGHVKQWVITSTNQWASGLFRYTPNTVLRIKYKVARTCDGLVYTSTRVNTSGSNDFDSYATLIARLQFVATDSGEWQTIEVRQSDWQIDLKRPPDWSSDRYMAFRLGIIGLKQECGLRIAELTVSPE